MTELRKESLIISREPVRVSISTETIEYLKMNHTFLSSREYGLIKKSVISQPPWDRCTKFMPFNEVEIRDLNAMYERDITKFESDNSFTLF